MSIVVVTAPASEPVSLAEAKLFLRVDQNSEDTLISDLIAAAREAVEAACGRALIVRSVRESLDDWRCDSAGAGLLSLGPVASVSAVHVLDDAGAITIVPASDYRLDSAGARARLVFPAGLPARRRLVGGIEITYDAGFSSLASGVPAALRSAVLQVTASLYEARQGEARMPEGARALVQAYQPVRL